MKSLVLMVGVPGSGKTTVAQGLIQRGYICLSADTIRQELWGDPADQREPARVFDLLYERLEQSLSQGADVVVDNTNINTRHREPIIKRGINAGYTDIQLWIIDVPLEVCLTRNRSRARSVPEDIVTNYFKALQTHGRPRSYEGKIIMVRPGAKDFEFKYYVMKADSGQKWVRND